MQFCFSNILFSALAISSIIFHDVKVRMWISGTHIECMASWMSCIQVLRSSRELAWTSTISGFAVPAVMRKRPRSSWATSRTISFCREITVARWSCWWEEWDTEWGGRSEAGRICRERKREMGNRGGEKTSADWTEHQHCSVKCVSIFSHL